MNQNANEGRQTKLFNPMYLLLMFFSMLTGLAFMMVTPVIPKYAVHIGGSLAIAGTLSGVYSITALVARPFSGVASDRLDRKKLMVISTTLIGILMLFYSMTANMPLLFAIRIAHGCVFAISGTTNMALASEFIPDGRLGEGIGYLGLGQSLSQAVGPGLGLWLSQRFGYQVTFRVGFAILMLVALGMQFLIHYKTEKKPAGTRQPIRLKDLIAVELLMLAAMSMMFSMTNGLISTFIALLGDERGIGKISLFFTVNALLMLVVRPASGKLNDKKGVAFIVIPSLGLCAVSMAMVGAAQTLFLILVAAVLKAIANGAGQPAVQTECIRRLGRERSGVATSTYFIGADIGQGFGATLGGMVSESYGYAAMYYLSGGLLLVTMGVAMAYFKFSKYYKGRRAELKAGKAQ